ncbi:unnamed protein product [Anisakis simplex]|uniref:Uncharacterized protein n=1 Tax=Anisakis simplex TaxID=6269 RepID=A0A0M3JKF7_ANISI|nr:unnamed protein product [Anisakis simplex]
MDAKLQIRFSKLSENAQMPKYGSDWAAGADLYSACNCTVPAKGRQLLSFSRLEIVLLLSNCLQKLVCLRG